MNRNVSATQLQTDLITATFPCTITGLRWDLSCLSEHNAVDNIAWAIVIIKQGNTASQIGLGDSGSFYNPETDCLAFGLKALDADAQGSGYSHSWTGSTKTMRKLMGGDKLAIIMKGSVGAVKNVFGCIQFFCKA